MLRVHSNTITSPVVDEDGNEREANYAWDFNAVISYVQNQKVIKQLVRITEEEIRVRTPISPEETS